MERERLKRGLAICPKCENEMVQGQLLGAVWERGRRFLKLRDPLKGLESRVFGYECPNCGYIELNLK